MLICHGIWLELALYMKSRLILKITVLMIWKTYHSISIAICQCVYLIIPLSMRDMTGFIPIKNSSSMELSRQISLAYWKYVLNLNLYLFLILYWNPAIAVSHLPAEYLNFRSSIGPYFRTVILPIGLKNILI